MPAQVRHGDRIAGIGGLLIPFAGLAVILGDALAVIGQIAQFVHGARVAACGGLL